MATNLPIIKYAVDERKWREEIKPYFLEKRGVPDIRKALEDFNVPSERIREIKKTIKKRKQKNTKISGTIGEICTSFFLEKKKKIYLVGLRRHREIFDIQTGFELIGIKSRSFDIIYAGIKEAERAEEFFVNRQKEGLPDELKDQKIDEYFRDETKEPATRLWITDLAKGLVEKGVIKANKSTVERLISAKGKYIRYGSLIHPPVDYEIDFSPEFEKLFAYCREKHEARGMECDGICSADCPDLNPICFIDMAVWNAAYKTDGKLL